MYVSSRQAWSEWMVGYTHVPAKQLANAARAKNFDKPGTWLDQLPAAAKIGRFFKCGVG